MKPTRLWRSLISITAVCFLLGLAGCGEGSASSPATPAPVVVRIGYFANVTHAQAVLGVSSGDFQTAVAPDQIKPLVFNAGPSLIEALFAGDVDIGYVGPGPVLTAWAQSHGQELQVISGSAANGVLIVASPKSGIRTLADLAGKKIATPQRKNTQEKSRRHSV